MGKKVAQFAKEYADREAIRECLVCYSRGADRIDRDAMLAAYWPDAVDDHGGIFKGSAGELIEHVLPLLKALDHSTHFLGNMHIDLDGDAARCETYVLAFYSLHEGDVVSNIVVGGRYLDGMAKRDDEWRIFRRTLVIDWFKNIPDPAIPAKALVAYTVAGARMPTDPSFAFFRR